MKHTYKILFGIIISLLFIILNKLTLALLLLSLFFLVYRSFGILSKHKTIIIPIIIIALATSLPAKYSSRNIKKDDLVKLGNIKVTEPSSRYYPIFEQIKRNCQYDLIYKVKTPFIDIYPVTFRLLWNEQDEIFHGGFYVLIKNIGWGTAKIIDIDWRIDSEKRPIGFSPPAEAFNSSNNYEGLVLKQFIGNNKILTTSEEKLFVYAPQMVGGIEISDKLTLTIKITYKSMATYRTFVTLYSGIIDYDTNKFFVDKEYTFKCITFDYKEEK